MSILYKKPVFQLKVEVFGTTHYIKVNGMTVLFDIGEEGQTSVTLPVNHWMRSGENSLGINVYPSKRGEALNPSSYVRLELTVHDLSEPDKVYTIATLHFSGTKDANDSHTFASSPSGIYTSNHDFAVDDKGDIRVYDIISKVNNTFDGALGFERKITIPSSLPLWAFFTSNEMEDFYKIENDVDYEKAMMPLFIEYEKVQKAIANRNIESILPMFKERNKETDIAFYLQPGTTAANLRESLLNTINDEDIEPVELKISFFNFHLEDNNKIVSLRREGLEPAIILNFINKKKGTGSRRYPMFFRYSNGKYILTR